MKIPRENACYTKKLYLSSNDCTLAVLWLILRLNSVSKTNISLVLLRTVKTGGPEVPSRIFW